MFNTIIVNFVPLYDISQRTVLKQVSNKESVKQKECREWPPFNSSVPVQCVYGALLVQKTSLIFFGPAFYLSGPLEGDALLKEDLYDGVCLVCSCIIITNPQSRSTSQTSSPKVSERSRASAIDDESCVSMLLGAVLAAAYLHCRYNGGNAYHRVSDHTELIIPGFLIAL